jgi:hypothetical protein
MPYFLQEKTTQGGKRERKNPDQKTNPTPKTKNSSKKAPPKNN